MSSQKLIIGGPVNGSCGAAPAVKRSVTGADNVAPSIARRPNGLPPSAEGTVSSTRYCCPTVNHGSAGCGLLSDTVSVTGSYARSSSVRRLP